MKILITGANGYLGNKLAIKLADLGHEVHALVRSSISGKFLQHPNITVFNGDIMHKESLMAAMKGCTQVYHTAAKVGAWAKDSSVFYEVNVEGTRIVLDTASACGVQKTVFTSTCGVIGPSHNEPLDEFHLRKTEFEIDYDLSKKQGEDLVVNYAKEGMNIVIVSPSKVYGPGNISHSLTANAIISIFLKKGIVFIPSPGKYNLCFAFIDDIITGHILAMEKGKSGEKYILGGINISYYEFFQQIRILSKCKGHIIMLPKSVILIWAYIQELNYKVWGIPVRFTVKSVNHLFSNYTFSSRKAMQELGYSITPIEEALQKTILFLNN